MCLAWNRHQAFTPIAEHFLKQLRGAFTEEKLEKTAPASLFRKTDAAEMA